MGKDAARRQAGQRPTACGPARGSLASAEVPAPLGLLLPVSALRDELEGTVHGLGIMTVALDPEALHEGLERLAPCFAIVVNGAWLASGGRSRVRELRRDRHLGEASLLALVDRHDSRGGEEARLAGAAEVLGVPLQVAELTMRLGSLLRCSRLQREVAHLREEHDSLLKIHRALTASLEPERILATIVCQVAEMVAANRVSIVRVDPAGGAGRILVDYEDPRVADLKLDLARYPEIRRALETGRPQTIADLASSPELEPLRAQLAGLSGTSVLAVPIDCDEKVLGPLVLRARRPERPFTPEEIETCQLIVGLSLNAIRNAWRFCFLQEEKERLELLSVTDQLTGAFNHAFLRMRLADELDMAHTVSAQFAFLMLDIDDFKRVNDRHGHLVGDGVLRGVADEIRKVIRKADFLARYGGEEFGILLPNTGRDGALRLADRVRRAIHRKRFPELPPEEHLTVSIGVSVYPDAGVTMPVDLIAQADGALYVAKARGKNRVAEHHPVGAVTS